MFCGLCYFVLNSQGVKHPHLLRDVNRMARLSIIMAYGCALRIIGQAKLDTQVMHDSFNVTSFQSRLYLLEIPMLKMSRLAVLHGVYISPLQDRKQHVLA